MPDGTIAVGIAQRLTMALAANDPVALGEIYAPGAVIWDSSDERELSVSQAQTLAEWIAAVADCTITVTSRSLTGSGFVQTQINEYRVRSGETVRFHCAVVAQLDEAGLIVRQEDYFDSARRAPLLAAAAQF